MAVTHWAPAHYRADWGEIAASGDAYRCVLGSVLRNQAGVSRAQFVQQFAARIDLFNRSEWGRTWVLTPVHIRNLEDAHYDFELAWRAVPEDTVLAYGV